MRERSAREKLPKWMKTETSSFFMQIKGIGLKSCLAQWEKGWIYYMRKRELTQYGKQVKHKLIEMNMTQVELAEQIGTSKQYLGKILYGERAGTMYLESIDQVLNLS